MSFICVLPYLKQDDPISTLASFIDPTLVDNASGKFGTFERNKALGGACVDYDLQ